jgi:predicted permease
MQIFNTIFPVFAIAAVGYLTTRIGIFKENDIRGMSTFVFNLALPVLLFNALSNLDLPPEGLRTSCQTAKGSEAQWSDK